MSRERFATGGWDGDPRGIAIGGSTGAAARGVEGGLTNASSSSQSRITFSLFANQWSLAKRKDAGLTNRKWQLLPGAKEYMGSCIP